MRFAPRKQNLSTNVLLACFAFSCAATSAHATEYEGPLNADNYGNEAFAGIVTGDDEEGYTYHFDDDDQIVLGSSSGNYVVGGQWGIDLTISGKISLVADVSSNTSNTTMINGIDVWAGSEESFYTLKTDDININVTHSATASSGNPWIYANGINNTYGETVTGSADITAKAIGKDVYAAVALGLISQNGGTISIDGGSIEVVAENNGFAAQAIGISDEGHNVRTDKITSSGELSITSNAVNSSEDTSSRAIAYGINNANSGDDPEVSVELVDTTIFAVAQAANGSAEAVGIYGGNASTTKVGEGSIYVETVADNSESSGQAYGIYTNVGAKTLTKGWGDITVRGSSAAVGIYADDGEVSYGGGTITADISGENDDGAALGIYIGETATVSLAGDTDVNAFDALMGTGRLVVKEQTVAGFFGSVDEFTGEVLVQGVTGLGMSTLEAESYREDTDGATLVLHAGSTLTGSYTIGANAQVSAGAKSGSSLDLLSDATLIIVASEDYDGNAALVTVDTASTESSSVVRLVNSARVDEGTTIFQVDEESIAPSDFVFKTDNLLTEVVDNRIVKKSVQSVFGNDLLLKNSVTAALYGEQGEGADRVIELTSDALSTVASAAELNKIALMGAAGGSQIAASNATLMIDDSLMRHGSALAMSERDVGQAALWIDLNGSVSRANDFSVGSINYGYKSDLAGASNGADYSLGNGSFVGATLSFGTGSVRGQGVGGGTKSDVDYWAVHAYGVWNTGIANVIGSFGWLQTNNEISQSGYSGKPNASAFTFSTRVEKSFELAGGYSATPHIGVRWSHIDADNFQAGGFDYRNETIDIVSFPVGVVFSNAFNSGDMSFKPYLDLEVAPTVGDTKTNNMVSLAGSAVEDIFEARIASSVVYSARLGVVGHVGSAHAFGFTYGVSAGNGDYVSQRLKVGYRYSF